MDDAHRPLQGMTESPLGKPSLQRHLPSLKTGLLRSSRACPLTFAPPTSRLAMARSNSSPDPFPPLSRPLWRLQLSQSHRPPLFIPSELPTSGSPAGSSRESQDGQATS